MAYKMADVDNITFDLHFMRSLSEFISNYVNEIAKEIKQMMLFLCGNMFGKYYFTFKTKKALSKTYNLILPKEYPFRLLILYLSFNILFHNYCSNMIIMK